MKTPLPKKLQKEEINDLPLKSYDGTIVLVRNLEDVPKACDVLRQDDVLGFDTETRPSFKKGESHLPSLIQLAGSKTVYIFQLVHLGFPEEVKQILADKTITKSGVSINFDLIELNRISKFVPRGFIDLGEEARKSGIPHHGLRGLAAYLLGFRISKQAQITKWDSKNLSEKQLTYAATDAWVGRKLYLLFREKRLI